MSKFWLFCAALLLQPTLAMASATNAAATNATTTAPVACTSPSQPIDEQGFVSIGGIEQWVTVKSEDCRNPVILFLHGGPGNPLSPFADAVYGAWAKDFTLVQWDQRGAGMTYGRSRPAADARLTTEQLSRDGAELAGYLAHRFQQRKIILLGSSWGSILGIHMVKTHPELFHAYLGTAQGVRYHDNQAVSYATLLERARAANDTASLTVLAEVGAPPWRNPRSFGKVRRVIRQYEARVTTPAPSHWWTPAADYATAQAAADYEAGEDFSFLSFVGLNGDGMFAQIDLPKLGTDFAIPMFFVHGAQDLLFTADVAQRYYADVKAPQKAFVLLKDAGHDPNQAVVDAQHQLLMERILPLTK